MSDPFLAEIRVFGFNFAPQGWALCNGQTIAITQNTALFSLLGTNFGGNGTTNFQLPNFQGSTACSAGQGTGLSPRSVGQGFGESAVTLLTTQLAGHSHTFNAMQGSGSQESNSPSAGAYLGRTLKQYDYTNANSDGTVLGPTTIGLAGGGQPHENRQPFLAMNYCIALQGIYPPRS